MDREAVVEEIERKYQSLAPLMDERTARVWAGTEANALGDGGIIVVCEATGMSRTRVRAGVREAKGIGIVPPVDRVRREGGGRKPLTEHEDTLLWELERLVDPVTRGDPESALRWTTKSLRNLADAMTQKGHPMSHMTVKRLLQQGNYRLQTQRKAVEGRQHPDRNEQFEYINEQVETFQREGLPVISVDTKKKELVGNYKNPGQQWLPQGQALRVNVHDFPDKALGKVIPYGVYDITKNLGWVNVGIDHDTSAFAVQSIRQWWIRMGRRMYPTANYLLINADGGGSNGSRSRLWKVALQALANETQLEIHVCHFPPGTSKWNKIEHRMFCHITENWRGQPLTDHETIVQLIGNTKTNTGLRIKARLDTRSYPTGTKVSDQTLDQVALTRDQFHGNWNYAISPHS